MASHQVEVKDSDLSLKLVIGYLGDALKEVDVQTASVEHDRLISRLRLSPEASTNPPGL
ncbi:hypothetical protein H4R33_002807 [Dimargaris cristalligena]|nr:hypothetical protein H4R33_002807 [Dimargaris cristalligena]